MMMVMGSNHVESPEFLQLNTSLSVPVNFLARGHATFQGGSHKV